jgi:hypothetical protein
MLEGSKLGVVKTAGLSRFDFDLYNIEGLSLGKLKLISRLLQNEVDRNEIARDIYIAIQPGIDERQTTKGI